MSTIGTLGTVSHYAVVRLLGAGGMGAVYEAVDRDTGRRVALKTLRRDIPDDAAQRTRFDREARAIAAMTHPNIAALYEFGEAEGVPFLAMELVEGDDLFKLLQTHTLSVGRTLDYAQQLAAALEHAHARGVLHRDLKLANVIISKAGELKLIDFGLARLTNSDSTRATREGTFIGTVAYAAPETLRGQEADARSDIYSFGVMLYAMLSGKLPFEPLEGASLIAAVLTGQAPPLVDRNPLVPPGLQRIVARAMALRPEERYQSAAELRGALAAADVMGPGPAVPARPAFRHVVAVLDFRDFSGDPASWLGSGIAETLSTDLQRLPGVQVVSRERLHAATPAMDTANLLAELARNMHATCVISGAVQRMGPRVRITAQLADTANGRLLGSARVDGAWDDLFALQDRLVEQVIDALRSGIGSDDRLRIAPVETLKLEAYEHYAQGRRCLRSLGKEDLERAREHFEAAVRLDPAYAFAHSGLGATYAMRFIHRGDPDDLLRSRSYLERATELDPEYAEPHVYLCYMYMRQGNLSAALAAGRRGLSLQPDSERAAYFLAVAEFASRDHLAAAAHYQLALCIDPDNEIAAISLSCIAVLYGQYESADRFLQQAIAAEEKPDSEHPWIGGRLHVGGVALRRGQWEQAREIYELALRDAAKNDHVYREAVLALTACGLGDVALRIAQPKEAERHFRRAHMLITEHPRVIGGSSIDTRALAGLAACCAANGDTQHARELLAKAESLLELVKQTPHMFQWDALPCQLHYALAVACCYLGELSAAVSHLGLAADLGFHDERWLATDPALAPLLSRPEFVPLTQLVASPPKIPFS